MRLKWRGEQVTGTSSRRSALKGTPMDFLCVRERQLLIMPLLKLDFVLLQAAVKKMQRPLQNVS